MAKSIAGNKAGHITNGDVLEDLGFSPDEIRETEMKMTIWRPLRAEVDARGLSQTEIARQLQMHQPDASLLLRGRLSKFSLTRLMQFAEGLGLTVRLMVEPAGNARHARTRGARPSALAAKRGNATQRSARTRAKVVA
jgi:predicted XRE-type DNA-binding protein